ncbi:thioredoxin family protein [Microbacterium phosphatis]|uniref:thioredoxin family protein n=1 Tax=Microbacterium phosphatis TaxID=3140248 RepID=UPI00314058D5
MSTVELTADTFEPTVTGDGIVLVDVWAEWCGPCKAFAPIYDAAASENPDITFGKVDSEAHPELSSALGVQAIPTLMVFRDGVGLFRQAGALPKAALDDLISQARALDMEQVRAAIADQQSQG